MYRGKQCPAIDYQQLRMRQQTISMEEHHKRFGKVDFLTGCFRRAVPVLDFVDWRIIELKPGYCKTMIPFDGRSKNQNASHQAALYLLAADYTGGTALGNHIKLPSLGIHPADYCEEYGIVFWFMQRAAT